MTFTNRAADEIKARLDQSNVSLDQLWAGTIHAFALEWILRPYAPYLEETRLSFTVADEFHTRRLLRELKRDFGQNPFFDVNTRRDRDGRVMNENGAADRICLAYKARLAEDKMLDYDDVLYMAYSILGEVPEIASTLAHVITLICVDEVQDTQDIQYGILSRIGTADGSAVRFFLVGDPNQSIYAGLGAVRRTPEEIKAEFKMESLSCLGLTGNYRSTQRIIDFYRAFQQGVEAIQALGPTADADGLITFQNLTVGRDALPDVVATLIERALADGVPASEICVLAPQWIHIRSIARALVRLLPGVDFDAPGLSPFQGQHESLWFKIARLFLTEPKPGFVRTRSRWAGEVIRNLEDLTGTSLTLPRNRSRGLLRFINSIRPPEDEGLRFLDAAFDELMEALGIDIADFNALVESRESFFQRAEATMREMEDQLPADLEFLRKLFKYPAGVVVNTCHGVKGEEYDVVICYGLLRGYVPNWNVIFGAPAEASSQAANLLYVICSRAKRRLHLIAESGRRTQRGNPYETTYELAALDFVYDAVD